MTVMTVMTVMTIMTGGFILDYDLVWDYVIGLFHEGLLKNVTFPAEELVGLFTFDGREIGGRPQVYVGLKF